MAKGEPLFHYSDVVRKATYIPDEKLIIKGGTKPLPPDHWCDGCGFATRLPDRFMCPFVEGSCARLPGTLDAPNPDVLHARIKYDRIYTDAHKEVFDGIAD